MNNNRAISSLMLETVNLQYSCFILACKLQARLALQEATLPKSEGSLSADAPGYDELSIEIEYLTNEMEQLEHELNTKLDILSERLRIQREVDERYN